MTARGLNVNGSHRRIGISDDTAQVVGVTVQYVIDTLTNRIVSREYGVDERLPSERQMALDLGVARNTVREALDKLYELKREAGE